MGITQTIQGGGKPLPSWARIPGTQFILAGEEREAGRGCALLDIDTQSFRRGKVAGDRPLPGEKPAVVWRGVSGASRTGDFVQKFRVGAKQANLERRLADGVG
jgi:hypothetical protein